VELLSAASRHLQFVCLSACESMRVCLCLSVIFCVVGNYYYYYDYCYFIFEIIKPCYSSLIEILLSLSHKPHHNFQYNSLLWNIKEDILRLSVFLFVFSPYKVNGNQNWLLTFFKTSSFLFQEKKSHRFGMT